MNSSAYSAQAVFDWGSLGRYEDVAPAMLPVAENVIDRAAPKAGERLLDIGCGTGNAALLAAARGALVTGVDPSPRLIEIAQARAVEARFDATFLRGNAAALPVADGSFDVLVDVLSLIFVADPAAAVAEMARVTAPGGRIVWTGWIPEGTVVEVTKASAMAAADVLGAPLYPYSAWHDREALDALFAPHGFEITLEESSVRYAAPSARAWLEGTAGLHPLAVAGNQVLASAGRLEELNARLLTILEAGNEDPQGFAVTPRYVIGVARRRL